MARSLKKGPYIDFRLEGKVERIRRSIGTDQSVLGEKENPIEYVENLYSEKATEYAETLEDDDDCK